MGIVIVVAGQKGGAGKSHFARHLAVFWSLLGYRVFIVDGDPQHTTLGWFQTAKSRGQMAPFTRSGVDHDEPDVYLRKMISEARERADIVLVDTAGSIDRRVGGAMREANLLLLPAVPDPDDMRALPKTLELARYGKSKKPNLHVMIAINKMGRTNLNKVARQEILECGLPVAKTEFPIWDEFKKAVALGMGVTSFAPKSDAAKLMGKLADEISLMIGDDFPERPIAEGMKSELSIEEMMRREENVDVAEA